MEDAVITEVECNIPSDLKKELEEQGYSNLIQTKNYGLVAIMRFAFTFGLVIKVDETGYNRRYCYPSLNECKIGYELLLAQDRLTRDVPEDPLDPYWIKRKGYNMRDIHNPNNPNLVQELKYDRLQSKW